MSNELKLLQTLEEYAKIPHDGVTVYDFGNGTVRMPRPKGDDPNPYKISFVCYLMHGINEYVGDQEITTKDGLMLLRNQGIMAPIEFDDSWTSQRLLETLEQTKCKMLEVACGKQE